jgi:fructokinase
MNEQEKSGGIQTSVNGRTKQVNGCTAPISVGAGLVALDWLLIGEDRVRPNEAYAGGSCGNVMAILAYLGWQSYPIARLGRDDHANRLLADFQRWNVKTDFLFREDEGATPIIIVRLKERKDGSLVRRYEWKHPSSGEWLPRYRPVLKRSVPELTLELPFSQVFYFDRVEPSLLLLATYMRERGSVIFFEPSAIKDFDLFSSCVAVADILKYSAERISIPPPRSGTNKAPFLEIQTLGMQGLRYRLKSNTLADWQNVEAFRVKMFKDDTGCGDWCTAGLIDRLCHGGRDEFLTLDEPTIQESLRFGQTLAAYKCEFFGARGPMYHLSVNEILRATANIE